MKIEILAARDGAGRSRSFPRILAAWRSLFLAVALIGSSWGALADSGYSPNLGAALAACSADKVLAESQYGGQPPFTWGCWPNNVSMSCYVLIQELTALTFFRPSYCAAPAAPTVVAIDPGHGFNCAAKGMAAGAIGETDFPVSDPPSGRLQEDSLTMAMALEIERAMSGSRYRVVLTKRSAVSCPSFIDRGLIANRAKAKVFVSIHVNRPNPVPLDLCCAGTSAIYNPDRPEAMPLADFGSASVAIALGVNNRGAGTDATLAVLKPNVTAMPGIILETARLSGNDEKILHRSDASVRVATGLKSALDSYFSK